MAVRRIQKIPLVATCDLTNNTIPTTPPTKQVSGKIVGVKIKTPAAVDSAATVAVTIKDADGDTIYTKSGIAVNTTNVEYINAANVPLQFPVSDLISINPVFSANQTVARQVTVTLFVDSYL